MSMNTTMKRIINGILSRTFSRSEYTTDYFETCKCFAISDEKNVYEIEEDTFPDFSVAAILFLQNNCIVRLATDVQFMNKGYASELLKTVISIYKNNKLNLHVRISNIYAIKLYEKCGFLKKEQIANYYKFTNNNEDAFYMELNC